LFPWFGVLGMLPLAEQVLIPVRHTITTERYADEPDDPDRGVQLATRYARRSSRPCTPCLNAGRTVQLVSGRESCGVRPWCMPACRGDGGPGRRRGVGARSRRRTPPARRPHRGPPAPRSCRLGPVRKSRISQPFSRPPGAAGSGLTATARRPPTHGQVVDRVAVGRATGSGRGPSRRGQVG